MNLYKKRTAKPYSLLVIDATFASDNALRFRQNLLERIQKLIMTIDDKIRDKILQYNINREAAKYLAWDEIFPSNRGKMIEPARKSFRKTNSKTDWCFKVPRTF